jgi:tetratricopeptide (TPR) repeat protein
LYENTIAAVIKKEDGYYLFSNGSDMKMHFSDETDFFNTESAVEKHFTKDASGYVTGYTRTLISEQLPKAVKVMNVDTLKGSDDFFNNIGWTLLTNKSYDESIKYLKRGLALYPGNLLIEGNLAHCYLFTNHYDDAIKMYRQHLKETIGDGFTWVDMIREDFKYFKSNQFNTSLMDRVIADLKL